MNFVLFVLTYRIFERMTNKQIQYVKQTWIVNCWMTMLFHCQSQLAYRAFFVLTFKLFNDRIFLAPSFETPDLHIPSGYIDYVNFGV